MTRDETIEMLRRGIAEQLLRDGILDALEHLARANLDASTRAAIASLKLALRQTEDD